jgi:hypothetical protein
MPSLLLFFWRWVLTYFLLRLASNCDPPDLYTQLYAL